MSSRQIQINLCYILHSRPYQDNSLIIQCLSIERGLISLLSKGARSSKKQLLSLLQPFQPLSISFLGKGDLFILTGVELYTPENNHISNHLLKGRSLYCAYYINELILRLFPLEEANPDLFSLYQKTLLKLQNTDSFEVVLRIFEIRLLVILGYELNLQYDIYTGKEIKDKTIYYYDLQTGPYEVKGNNPEHNKQQSICISGNTLIAISHLNFENQQVKKESKLLLRQVLKNHLGDKPLKSREVYRQLYS